MGVKTIEVRQGLETSDKTCHKPRESRRIFEGKSRHFKIILFKIQKFADFSKYFVDF